LLRPYFGKKHQFGYMTKDENKKTKFGDCKIESVYWCNNNYQVPIRDHKSTFFQIKSDICKNYYQKYYYKQNATDPEPETPGLIHIQTHLGGKGDELLGTPLDPFASLL